MRKTINKIYDTETADIEIGKEYSEGKKYESVSLYYSPEADEYFLHIVFSDRREEIVPVSYAEIQDWWDDNGYGNEMAELADEIIEKKKQHVCLK